MTSQMQLFPLLDRQPVRTWLEVFSHEGKPLLRLPLYPEPDGWDYSFKWGSVLWAMHRDGRWQPGEPFTAYEVFEALVKRRMPEYQHWSGDG